ncbi:MAG: hypothetical protein WC868_05570 [Bacteroidales bacterium]
MENNFSNIVDSGLCSTCIHKTGCMYRKTFKGKIIQCEEFEITENSTGKSQYVKNQIDVNNSDSENYTGLCKNCDLRKTCMLYSSDKINWNCEEYQ